MPPQAGDCTLVDWDLVSVEGDVVTIRAYLNSPGCAEQLDRVDVNETSQVVTLTAFAKYTAVEGVSCPTALGNTEVEVQLDADLADRTLDGCRPTDSFAPSGGYNEPAPRSDSCDQ